jgi:ATP-dependent DNA helicase RecG
LIIVVDVGECEQKPALAFGKPFIRVGKSNQKIGYEGIRRLALKTSKVYWDGRACEGAEMEDIDEDKVEWFLKRAKYERRLELDPGTSVRESMEKLKLLNKGIPTNAAILLFGKNPQRFFAQSETRCARFKGLKPLEFIDMKVFGRDIIGQRDDALEFVKEHIRLHAHIKGTERVERWEYPIEAIREAITNAICHRDYEIASNTQIRIFDDRIEVWGCGLLPEPLVPDDLKGEHKSILRNPSVGECLFLIKFIEHWGTGTNRMIERCLEHGMPEPQFGEIAGDFVVTFRKYTITDEILNELNERQQKAIKYLLKHKKITNREYREINLDISDRTALNDLNELVQKNVITAKGEKKHRYYILR